MAWHDELLMDNHSVSPVLLLMLAMVLSSGCLDTDSDWDYEFYYYVDVHAGGAEEFELNVPIPLSESLVTNIVRLEGNFTYSIIENEHGKFLDILGNSSLSLSSTRSTYDDFLDHELREDDPYRLYCSKDINISVVVESRVLSKRTDTADRELYYSSIFRDDLGYITIDEFSWTQHLPQEYAVSVGKGWTSHECTDGRIIIK